MINELYVHAHDKNSLGWSDMNKHTYQMKLPCCYNKHPYIFNISKSINNYIPRLIPYSSKYNNNCETLSVYNGVSR